MALVIDLDSGTIVGENLVMLNDVSEDTYELIVSNDNDAIAYGQAHGSPVLMSAGKNQAEVVIDLDTGTVFGPTLSYVAGQIPEAVCEELLSSDSQAVAYAQAHGVKLFA